MAAVLWQTAGWGFAFFVVNSTKYAAIYSGFAILILFMIWLYLSWLILLFGASVAFYHQHPEYLQAVREPVAPCPGNRQRERIGLNAMCLIADCHFEGMSPPTAERLVAEIGASMAAVEDALELLHREGLVIAVGSTPEAYLPGRAPERIALQAVWDALRQSDESPTATAGGSSLGQRVDAIIADLEQSTERSLAEKTLRDLLLAGDARSGSPVRNKPTGVVPTSPHTEDG